MNTFKLGLQLGSDPIKRGALDLEKYIADPTVTVPTTLTRSTLANKYAYGMLDNDTYGDCVPASMYHIQEIFALRKGLSPVPWAPGTCLTEYFHINGVVPGPPESPSDQGTDPSTAMQYWQNFGLPGHKLAGFGVLDVSSAHIKRAMWEFGAVMFAIALPVAAQSQGVNWRYLGSLQGNGAAGSWGGHAIAGDSYDADLLGFISWGMKGDMDNPFWTNYGEQVLVPLSTAQLNSASVGPAGFDFAQMKKDLGLL